MTDCEQYRFRLRDGTHVPLPQTAAPEEEGVEYDLVSKAGTLADAFHLEGTGKPLPGEKVLRIQVRGATEAEAKQRCRDLIDAARAATALERDGSPDEPLLGLRAGTYTPIENDSRFWLLTLTLLPASPSQSGGSVEPPPTGGPSTTTATLTLTVTSNGGPAPLTVTNITTGGIVFDGTLAGSRQIPGLMVGHQFRGVPGAQAGYVTPAPRTGTLGPAGLNMLFDYQPAGTPVTPPPDTGVY